MLLADQQSESVETSVLREMLRVYKSIFIQFTDLQQASIGSLAKFGTKLF